MKAASKSSGFRRLDRLYDQLVYCLYDRQSSGRARPYANLLETCLAKSGDSVGAIFAEECRSLIDEAQGDLEGAIRHRTKEIDLIKHLHQIAHGTPDEATALEEYDYDDLRDRLVLLAMLYHDSGRLDKAIETLVAARELCEARGIEFDEEDLLHEYVVGRGNAAARIEFGADDDTLTVADRMPDKTNQARGYDASPTRTLPVNPRPARRRDLFKRPVQPGENAVLFDEAMAS
jgi:hypothetical protein